MSTRFLATTAACGFLMAPTVYRRLHWRRDARDKERMPRTSDAPASAGIALLACAMSTAVFVDAHVIAGLVAGVVATVVAALLFLALWFAPADAPLARPPPPASGGAYVSRRSIHLGISGGR